MVKSWLAELVLLVIFTGHQCVGQPQQTGGISLGSNSLLSSDGDVMVLTDSNFASRLAEIDLALVKFYAPWCGHCRQLAPEFRSAAVQLKDNSPPATLAEVDCEGDGKGICAEYGISEYPILKAFRHGEVAFDYDGPRTSSEIVWYMKSKLVPASKELKTIEDALQFFNYTELIVVGFFEDNDSDKLETFQSVADFFGNRIRFGHTFSAEVCANYSFKNEIVLFREPRFQSKLEASQIPFRGNELTLSNLKGWIFENMHSLVGHRTSRNEEEFKVPLVVVYYDVNYLKNAKGTNYWRNRIVKVAKKYSDANSNVSFAMSNAFEFKRELNSFGLQTDKLPVVAARNMENQKFTMTEEFSIENLENFVDSFLEGKMKPYLKSEPVPETNDEPVKVVVAETFNEIVNDVTKDVLIELYSPMCGHCMVLAPKFEKLAIKLKDEPDLVIAKIDGTANEVPEIYDIQGFPTIYFVPKESKNNPVLYRGEREVDDFVKFLAEKATNPLNGFDRTGNPRKTKSKLSTTEL